MQNQKKMNDFIDKKIQEYVEISSQGEPELLKKLTKETHLKVLHPRMLCSPYQGRLLSLISKIHNPSSVLEIGTYTGYSTLCIAEGLKKNGTIFTIDCNEELLKIQNIVQITKLTDEKLVALLLAERLQVEVACLQKEEERLSCKMQVNETLLM